MVEYSDGRTEVIHSTAGTNATTWLATASTPLLANDVYVVVVLCRALSLEAGSARGMAEECMVCLPQRTALVSVDLSGCHQPCC
jgi:hypothetical protein